MLHRPLDVLYDAGESHACQVLAPVAPRVVAFRKEVVPSIEHPSECGHGAHAGQHAHILGMIFHVLPRLSSIRSSSCRNLCELE